MSPRRTSSLPAVSPTSVIIEFHEFEGRWFITGRWGQGSGTEVERTVRNSALGKVLLDRVEGARQERRWRASRVLADETERWARFCAEEAGVPIDRYRPEKRIVILAGQTGITWHDAAEAPPNWAALVGIVGAGSEVFVVLNYLEVRRWSVTESLWTGRLALGSSTN